MYAATEPIIIAIATIAIMVVYLVFIFFSSFLYHLKKLLGYIVNLHKIYSLYRYT